MSLFAPLPPFLGHFSPPLDKPFSFFFLFSLASRIVFLGFTSEMSIRCLIFLCSLFLLSGIVLCFFRAPWWRSLVLHSGLTPSPTECARPPSGWSEPHRLPSPPDLAVALAFPASRVNIARAGLPPFFSPRDQ